MKWESIKRVVSTHAIALIQKSDYDQFLTNLKQISSAIAQRWRLML